MIKARFSEHQPAVRIFAITAVIIQYQIALHEEVIEPEEEGQEEEYLYDFNEFVESTDVLAENDVIADPESYLDYVPVKLDDRTEEGRTNLLKEINAIKERQDLTDMAMQELILAQLGGE